MEGSNRRDRLTATLARRWERFELPLGLALVAAGFIAIAAGWFDASSTPDVRRQLQSFLSGGFGGLALVLLGASLLQARVASRIARAQEAKLDRVADALLALAHQGSPVAPGSNAIDTPVDGETLVVASHVAFHLPQCDLISDRADLRRVSLEQAVQEGLQNCGVCLAPVVAR